MERDVYSGKSELYGEQSREALGSAYNYAATLNDLERFEEAKSLLRKMMPIARRVLGESHELTSKMRLSYALALSTWTPAGAPLDDLREAVTTLEETKRIARRVLGWPHPTSENIERALRTTRAALRAREQPSDDEDA